MHRFHQRDIFSPPVIGIASYIARIAVPDLAGSVGEAVPNGLAFAIFVPRALDLVGGGSGAPKKSLGKRHVWRCAELHGGAGWLRGDRLPRDCLGRAAASRKYGRQRKRGAGSENRLNK